MEIIDIFTSEDISLRKDIVSFLSICYHSRYTTDFYIVKVNI